MNRSISRLKQAAMELEREKKQPELRTRPRTAAREPVTAMVEADGVKGVLPATVRDLSRGGVGLNLPVPLQKGTRFEFRAMVGAVALRASCRVMNCRPDGKGGYIIGGEIVSAERLARCAEGGREGVDEELVKEVGKKLLDMMVREDVEPSISHWPAGTASRGVEP